MSEALAGATDEELDAHPAPGKWSAREIVHHLADSEMTSAIRLRLLLAVDNPKIAGYDQEEFARRLYYDRPIEPRSSVQGGAADDRRDSGPDDRRRMVPQGTHSELRSRTHVERWLEIYAVHAHDHADADQRRARRGAEAAESKRLALNALDYHGATVTICRRTS